jgi:hypothetical protein
MTKENQARVYGMADQANRHPPAAQGMRGENSSAPAEGSEAEFSHAVTLESGKRVVVSEGNGVAYAEASGRIPAPEVRHEPEELEIEFVPSPAERRAPATPLLIGALIAGASAGLYLADRWLRSRTDHRSDHDTQVRFGDLGDERESRALVPVQELPHRQQPTLVETEISASASRT